MFFLRLRLLALGYPVVPVPYGNEDMSLLRMEPKPDRWGAWSPTSLIPASY